MQATAGAKASHPGRSCAKMKKEAEIVFAPALPTIRAKPHGLKVLRAFAA
jgi:hypothetical protein